MSGEDCGNRPRICKEEEVDKSKTKKGGTYPQPPLKICDQDVTSACSTTEVMNRAAIPMSLAFPPNFSNYGAYTDRGRHNRESSDSNWGTRTTGSYTSRGDVNANGMMSTYTGSSVRESNDTRSGESGNRHLPASASCGCDHEKDGSDLHASVLAEARHFRGVCLAFENYTIDAMREVARIEAHYNSLSDDDKKLLIDSIPDRVSAIKAAILNNQQFLDLILIDQESFGPTCAKSINGQSFEDGLDGGVDEEAVVSEGYHNDCFLPAADDHHHSSSHNDSLTAFRNISKVRSTLRQFVRDWSQEGQEERDGAYGPLIEALEEYVPLSQFIHRNGRQPRVLCPGSGLGRLPFEVVRRGYACQGNEFSYFMLLGSNLMLNSSIPVESCMIQPYCLSTSNRINHNDHLVAIRIPDVSPVNSVAPNQDFSICAGEFVEVYWEQKADWDVVLTCFFIDTAKNVLQYIRTIARILKTGGVWANLGPLLYHFSDVPNEVSIELSWEEIKLIIEPFFNFEKIEFRESYYTTNKLSMMQVKYKCVHFVAIRNPTEFTGYSKSVY